MPLLYSAITKDTPVIFAANRLHPDTSGLPEKARIKVNILTLSCQCQRFLNSGAYLYYRLPMSLIMSLM